MFIKKYSICSQNKKNIFKKLGIVQIIPGGPRDIYQMDLTNIPDKLKKDKEYRYLLTIIDTFSKYAYAYLLNNKKSENILVHLKDFINIHGKCAKLHTDNGKEFVNTLISDYCQKKDIILIHGRPLPSSVAGMHRIL